MAEVIQAQAVADALARAAAVLEAQSAYFTELDQAMGDGDMGITMGKIGVALQAYAADTPVGDDIGKWLAQAGMTANRAGPSTMGTLLATALMRAGKEVRGKTELTPADLATMFRAAAEGMQERGKAKLGDKTILDAIFPAADAFAAAVGDEASVAAAGGVAVDAAAAGRDAVTPLRSRIGRAGWVGERTEGKVDPGCAMLVMVLEAITSED
ncbi:MAG: DAK2 domain-containing protein [Caldilineaceae bacterium]|nr:DAK2 domain-containing protein [Caldilineaceae bacterium]